MTNDKQYFDYLRLTSDELRELLDQGSMNFSYTKRDGTIRKAWGTRMTSLIPAEAQPKGTDSNSKAVSYYDLERKAWRSVGAEATIFA